MAGMSRREQVLWVFVFAVPPGIGVTGFVSVMFARGGLSPGAVAAGLVTALAVGGLVAAAFRFGPDESAAAEESDTADGPAGG